MPAFAQLRFASPSAPIELEEAVVVGPPAAAAAPEAVNWNGVTVQFLAPSGHPKRKSPEAMSKPEFGKLVLRVKTQ